MQRTDWLKTTKRFPTLPELIVQAVTECAAVRELHYNGGVVWSADALDRLQAVLMRRYKAAARNSELQDRALNVLNDSLRDGATMEKAIGRAAFLILVLGTGMKVEE